jgi:plasmid maintenance system antidote protein VapI
MDIERDLRDAIINAPITRYRLSKETGVSETVLSLFVNRKRTLRLDTAAKLAAALGLELRAKDKGR